MCVSAFGEYWAFKLVVVYTFNRLLMYAFVNDHFMVPEDPLGKHGPFLDEYLSHVKPSQPK